jgi:hypothetical protein
MNAMHSKRTHQVTCFHFSHHPGTVTKVSVLPCLLLGTSVPPAARAQAIVTQFVGAPRVCLRLWEPVSLWWVLWVGSGYGTHIDSGGEDQAHLVALHSNEHEWAPMPDA